MEISKVMPPGNHYLTLQTVRVNDVKVTLVMKPIAAGYDPVLRTYTLGTPSFVKACQKFGSAEPLYLPDELEKLFCGTWIFAELGPARNPKYIDLVKILSVHRRYPGEAISLYLKGFNKSFYSKNTSEAFRP